MTLERPYLFGGRDIYWFLLVCALFAAISLSVEYFHYIKLTTFDDVLIDAEVVHQYSKTKKEKNYQVLKLRTDDGVQFYTTGSKHLRDLQGYRLQLVIRTNRLSYLDYLKGFFAYSKILKVYPQKSMKRRLSEQIASGHSEKNMQQIYGALFTASPMDQTLRIQLSSLGISHLLAISGFHLGVLSFILFLLLKPLYALLQHFYFPYRHSRRDIFIMTIVLLFAYVWFLDFVPSLVRAFAMMAVGFILYDRGVRLISIQSLMVVILLLLSLWPRLFFALGFWLSVSGVFFILLFLQHFSHWDKFRQFIGLHIWIYAMMLPLSFFLFQTFSPLHPLSVLWTMLFILFYPAVLLLHIVGYGSLLDTLLAGLLNQGIPSEVTVEVYVVLLQFLLAFAAVRYKKALLLLLIVTFAVFVGAVYQIA